MRWIWASLGAIVLAGAAQADPMQPSLSDAQPVPAHASARVERLDDSSDLDLDAPVSLALPHWRPSDLDQRYDPRMEDPGPEGLSISVRLNQAVRVYIAADLDAELPRLDALDGDTYFMPGVEVALTPQLRVFLEDFQPASMVVGGDEDRRAPPTRSWDGHQVAVGARYALGAQVEVEASAVGYVLSAYDRPAGVGAAASVTVRF